MRFVTKKSLNTLHFLIKIYQCSVNHNSVIPLGVLAYLSCNTGTCRWSRSLIKWYIGLNAGGLEFRNWKILLQLYRISEFYPQCWPLTNEMLQWDLRQFKRNHPVIPGVKGFPSTNMLGLYSSEFRRMRSDVIKTYNILRSVAR